MTAVIAKPRTCKVCDRKHKGHGYCKQHLEQWQKHHETWEIGLSRKIYDGCMYCSGAHLARGMCRKHYDHWRRVLGLCSNQKK